LIPARELNLPLLSFDIVPRDSFAECEVNNFGFCVCYFVLQSELSMTSASTHISLVLEYLGLAEFDPQPNKYLFAPPDFFFRPSNGGGVGNGNIKIIFDVFSGVQSEPPGPSWFLTFLFPPLSHSTGCPAFVHTISSNGTNGLGGGLLFLFIVQVHFQLFAAFSV